MPPNHRILYFSTQFPTLRSPSMGAFSLQRVKALRRAGCDVVVVSPLLMNPPPHLLTAPGQAVDWLRQQSEQPRECIYQGVPAYYPRWFCPPRQIFGWMMSDFLRMQVGRRVAALAKAFHPDVILSSWLPDAVAAAELGSQLHLPVLAIADGTDVNFWPEKYRGWSRAREVINRKAAVMVFVSGALRAAGNAKGLYGKNQAVLHNAVDTRLFRPTVSRAGPDYTILGIGRMLPMKGFHQLLDAFAQFNRCASRPARLVLVGEGPQRLALQRQAADLGIDHCVQLVDPMDQEHLVGYYQSADVFCLPSFSEGFPCVVVEAMACGKPVVATKVGGVAEVVDEQSGILVAPGDAAALCGALLKASSRDWDAGAIRQKIIDGFSWEQWTETMLRLMDSAVMEY